jgi:hypothetical protein
MCLKLDRLTPRVELRSGFCFVKHPYMPDFGSEIDEALRSEEKIPRDQVVRWIDSAGDLSTLAKLYRMTGEFYHRIDPDLGKETTCALIQRYLLECIRQGVQDENEEIEDRWEAAQSLHVWFRHILEMGDSTAILTRATQAVTNLFLTSGDDIRNAIEQGFLEHALETADLRPYFEYWSKDERLQDAWERALNWGKAHPDYMWGLFQGQGRTIGQDEE